MVCSWRFPRPLIATRPIGVLLGFIFSGFFERFFTDRRLNTGAPTLSSWPDWAEYSDFTGPPVQVEVICTLAVLYLDDGSDEDELRGIFSMLMGGVSDLLRHEW